MRSLNQSKPIRLTPLSPSILFPVFSDTCGRVFENPEPKPKTTQSATTNSHTLALCGPLYGGRHPQTTQVALWATLGHSGHPMVWDYPQFSHRAEPKALNLLQGGTLWHSLMVGIIRGTIDALYGPLCATLGEAITGGLLGNKYCPTGFYVSSVRVSILNKQHHLFSPCSG